MNDLYCHKCFSIANECKCEETSLPQDVPVIPTQYTCKTCGQKIKGNETHNCPGLQFSIPKNNEIKGWICPVCGAGMSPYINKCNCKQFYKSH